MQNLPETQKATPRKCGQLLADWIKNYPRNLIYIKDNNNAKGVFVSNTVFRPTNPPPLSVSRDNNLAVNATGNILAAIKRGDIHVHDLEYTIKNGEFILFIKGRQL